MTELTLTPLLNNGSNFFTSNSFYGSGYTNAALYVELIGQGQIWFEISTDGNNWYRINNSVSDVNGSDLIPIQGFNSVLLYRIATTINATTVKLIS